MRWKTAPVRNPRPAARRAEVRRQATRSGPRATKANGQASCGGKAPARSTPENAARRRLRRLSPRLSRLMQKEPDDLPCVDAPVAGAADRFLGDRRRPSRLGTEPARLDPGA